MQPDYARLMAQADAAFRSGDLPGAERLAREASAAQSSGLDAKLLLGTVLAQMGRPDEAVAEMRAAVSLDPSSAQARISLGQMLLLEGEGKDAIEQAEGALLLDGMSMSANHLLVDALLKDDQPERAQEHLRRLIEELPQSSQLHAKLGQTRVMLGQMEEARASFMRSIECQPVQGFAYFSLATSMRIRERDRDLIRKMEELAADPAVNEIGKRHLSYGLGKAYEDLGDYSRAMGWFHQANRLDYRLKFGDRPFDRQSYKAGIDAITRTFDAEFMRANAGVGTDDPFPIFIVGMIRSGTTLAEQILSHHPQVHATGEQAFWSRHWQDPLVNGVFDQDRAKETARRYLSMMRAKSPEAVRVTDKMPANHAYLGPIHLLLPAAKIIHMRRSPADTCLSIYTTPNPARNPATNDPSNIAFAYRHYRRLMEHWRVLLPKDSLLEIDYEELVLNQEQTSRQILQFSGLDWDRRCLMPQANDRQVATPSAWQVRQPVYSSSIGRWRNYEPWLGEILEL